MNETTQPRYAWLPETRVICSRWYPAVCTETRVREPNEVVSDSMCGPCSVAFLKDSEDAA